VAVGIRQSPPLAPQWMRAQRSPPLAPQWGDEDTERENEGKYY